MNSANAHQSQFSDVPVTHPAFEEIDFVIHDNILSAFPDHSFRPDAPLQPDALRAALVRVVGEKKAAPIWQDLKNAKGGRPLSRAEAAVLLTYIAKGKKIDFKKPLNLAQYSAPANTVPSAITPPIASATAAATQNLCPKAAAFFSQFKDVTVHCDSTTLYIESSGMPDHEMMVGITSTNQQVPLPQNYRGDNAWKIPLHPVVASSPTATTGGPIGIAINGVPIFDPSNQGSREDTKKEGELDRCNGHAGRADDYHYHAAPVCLMKQRTDPAGIIGFALDGYPIGGFVDSWGSKTGLDRCNGKMEAGGYRYHVTNEYPYVIACFTGIANMNSIPTMQPLRPPGEPMRHILITDFYQDKDGWWVEKWKKGGAVFTIKWKQATDACWDFIFVNHVKESRERYCRR